MGKRRRNSEIGQCSLCPYVSCEENLIWHMNNVHHIRQKESSDRFNETRNELESQVTKCPKIEQEVSVMIENNYSCGICSFKAKYFGGLIQHIQDFHHYNLIYCCKHCSYISSMFELAKHYIEKHSSGMFRNCMLCLYTSYSITNILQHLEDVHKPNRILYNCLCCSTKFTSLASLIFHSESRHSFSFEDCFKLTNIIDLYCNNTDESNSLCHHVQHVNSVSLTLNSRNLISNKSVLHQYFENKFTLISSCSSNMIAKNDSSLPAVEDKDKLTSVSEFAKDAQLKKLSLKCELCNNFTFDEYNSLTQHVKDAHKLNKLYQCLSCLSCYNNSFSFAEHLHALHRSEVVLLKCTLCSYATINRFKLYQHTKRQHIFDNQVINCTSCSNNASSLVNLKDKHKSNHSVFKCSTCSCTSPRSISLIEPKSSECKDEVLEQIELIEPINDSNTASTALNINPQRNQNINIYETDHIHYSSSSSSSKKRGNSISNLKDEHLECINSCENSETKAPSGLVNNVTEVSTASILKCKCCSYSTVDKASISQHINDKHWKCCYCPYYSDVASSLGDHMKSKHMIFLSSLEMDVKVTNADNGKKCVGNKLACQESETLIINDPNFLNQVQGAVTDTSIGVNIKCKSCSYSTTKPYSLIQHAVAKHSVQSHKCPYCSYTSGSKSSLTDHTNAKHKLLIHTNGNSTNSGNEKNDQSTGYICEVKTLEIKSVINSNEKKDLVAHGTDSLDHTSADRNIISYKCEYCSYSTLTQSKLNKHLVNKHKIYNAIYTCSSCSYFSNKLSSLTNHTKDKHKVVTCETPVQDKIKSEELSPDNKSPQLKSPVTKNDAEQKKSAINHSDYSSCEAMNSTVGLHYKCQHCTYFTVTQSDLSQHLKTNHSGPQESVFESTRCLNIFENSSSNKSINDDSVLMSNSENIKSKINSDEEIKVVCGKDSANEGSVVINTDLAENNQQYNNSNENNGVNLPFSNYHPYYTLKIFDFNMFLKDKYEPGVLVNEYPCHSVMPFDENSLVDNDQDKHIINTNIDKNSMIEEASKKSVSIQKEYCDTVSEEKLISNCNINDSATDDSDPVSSLNFADLLTL